MANKKPVLGVVTCTKQGCSGDMVVRSRNAGRGGHTKKYGHCKTCGHLEQKNDMQAHLGSYRDADPVKPLEAPPVVKSTQAAKGVIDEFDPVEINHIPTQKTPIDKPAPASNGGVLKMILGGFTIVGIAIGVGYAAAR